MNRIFISYRSSDGKKDANRLAEDLNRVFGDEQVFFDKHDLQGGEAWRSAIGDTLGQRPVVLLLMTPDLIAAAHPEGGRRVDQADDPIRMEVVAAHGHGALIVPLLTEGMVMPGRALLPPDLHFLAEAHALKLRTDDWTHDLQRLVADLTRHGVEPRAAAPVAAPAQSLTSVWVVFGLAVLLFVIVVAMAEHEPTPQDHVGAAVVLLFPLGMFIYCFQRLRAAGRAGRWAALGLAVLSGVMAFAYIVQGDWSGGDTAVGYLPPVTSTMLPVV
jgi:hypothetical protein